jgi:hypothetical protein
MIRQAPGRRLRFGIGFDVINGIRTGEFDVARVKPNRIAQEVSLGDGPGIAAVCSRRNNFERLHWRIFTRLLCH